MLSANNVSGADAPVRRRHRCAPCHQIQRLDHEVRRAVAVRGLELVTQTDAGGVVCVPLTELTRRLLATSS